MVNHEPVSDTGGFQEAKIETNRRRKEGGNIRMKEQRKKERGKGRDRLRSWEYRQRKILVVRENKVKPEREEET